MSNPVSNAGAALYERLAVLRAATSDEQLIQRIRAIEIESAELDPAAFARLHCDALHSATHPPKLARPCVESRDVARKLVTAHNAALDRS